MDPVLSVPCGVADGPALVADIQTTSIALSEDGVQLFLSDSVAHVVRRVDLVAGTITTVAGVPFLAAYAGDGACAHGHSGCGGGCAYSTPPSI